MILYDTKKIQDKVKARNGSKREQVLKSDGYLVAQSRKQYKK